MTPSPDDLVRFLVIVAFFMLGLETGLRWFLYIIGAAANDG